ncbi:hypothetical protein GLAREA_02303 [Glarea lozoyensis ATCC 20868]|uniref:Heterokaryon incompatibility domain-containing protein n=1 Tax=Glarea lozoyensis (strain ATCC 20868 / MF5171) TaxID=1116229 RepID=S3CKW1_GLAL2|nr:uncharacterized protein GLAREA_02303 [Glarea lozoyensis ATCC 20868]EPE26390.1 hypothetical protein GLAREA_02303 [Glarea lozoyensis ATCC 20868]
MWLLHTGQIELRFFTDQEAAQAAGGCAIGCYAYLSDVSIALSDHPELVDRKVSQSKWFTGGWTLQELLAPLSVVFLDSQWETIGTKENLSRLISNVTKIPTSILLNCAVEQVSVAQIMYWASKRKTTRVEDRAYSLIGLFNVNMPMIYGEGEKAFTRLQHEIIKIFDDQSLFTWTGWRGDRGAVARYPDEFEAYGTVKQHPSSPGQFKPRFSTTNRGLRMELHLNSTSSPEPAVAYLDCYSDDGRYLGIFLSRVSGNYFVRSGTSLWQGERVQGFDKWLKLHSVPAEMSLHKAILLCHDNRDEILTRDADQNSCVRSSFGTSTVGVSKPGSAQHTVKAIARHVVVGDVKQCDIRITVD